MKSRILFCLLALAGVVVAAVVTITEPSPETGDGKIELLRKAVHNADRIADALAGGLADDTAYGAGWNGSTLAPTQNSVYDKIEAISLAGFDSTAVDATTWSDNANATNLWTFDVSGTDTTVLFGSAAWSLGAGTSALEFRLLEPSGSGSNYTGFKSPALAGNVMYTLPTADGTNGYVLSTNGSGALSWVAQSAGASLTDTYVGFGSGANALTGAAEFTWNNTGKVLDVVGQIETEGLIINKPSSAAAATLDVSNLTSERTFSFPDATGFMALEADPTGFDGNLANTDNTLQEIAQKLDDLATGGTTNINDIGDATADGTVAQGAHEMDFTSTIDAAGEAIWTVTNTDADAANDNSFLDLRHNDGADANIFYARFIGDNDGTPSTDYSFGQTAFSIGSGVTTTFGGAVNVGTLNVTTLNATTFAPTTIELGHASDTTLARSGAGAITVENTAVLLSGGALGTPSSGTVTNLTGTASININGTVGATTPTTGAFTTLTTSGAYTLQENASIALDPAGSADGKYTGITIAGTAGATLAFGDIVYLAAADSRWELADCDSATTSGNVLIGMCVLAAAADGNSTTILLSGTIRADAAFPALTISAPAYISGTAGDIQVAAPSTTGQIVRRVGFALTADELYFNPSADSGTAP